MKKLIFTLALMLSLFGLASAQTAAGKTAAKPTFSKAAPATTTTTVKTKADGTPDMRYKANKTTTTVVAGPKKKDGTADMRYKKNKAAAAKVN